MSVVGDIVDMKVDGPTRIDFSEQVKTYDVRVLSSPLRNYFRPTKKGKEKKYDNFLKFKFCCFNLTLIKPNFAINNKILTNNTVMY